MLLRHVLLTGILLAILSPGTCCELNDTASIRRCVKELLEAGRDSMKSELDPLSLKTTRGVVTLESELEEWVITNPTVTGLGNYIFEGLDVDLENSSAIRVKSDLTWPSLTLRAQGSYHFCNKTTTPSGGFRRSCVEPGGEVAIRVKKPAGRATILLEPSLQNSRVQIEPTSQIGVNFLKVSVNIALSEGNKRLDIRFESPSAIYRNELLNYWTNTVETLIADKILSQLRKVTNTYLPERLASRWNLLG